MILTCEKCDTSFSFDENLIKSSGSKVRCSKCRHIFVVFPPTSFNQNEPAALPDPPSSGKTPVAAAAGLDDLDLDAIEKSLDLDDDPGLEVPAHSGGMLDDSGLNLDFEEDDIVAAADAGEASVESTDELDFDLDLDFDSLHGEDAGGNDLTAEATETMDFQLDLDLDDEMAESRDDGDAADDDLSFDLDQMLDELPEGSDSETDGESTDELDLQLKMGDDGADLSRPENPFDDTEVEQGDKPVVADSGVEFDETQELDLSDVDSLLDLGHQDDRDSITAESTESLDFDLDFGQEAESIADDGGEEPSNEEFALELDLDADDTSGAAEDQAGELESTEELDLADLEEMIESEADDSIPKATEPEIDELDFGIDQTVDIDENMAAETAGGDSDITDDFDLTGLDDLLDLDDEPVSSDDEVDADIGTVEAGLKQPAGGESLSEDLDLDDMFDLDSGEVVSSDAALEAAGDMDLILDDDLNGTDDADVIEAGEDQGEDEFDLSDLDDMLEMDDSHQDDAADDDEEFELELDLDDVAKAGGSGETDLEFEVEEEEPEGSGMAETAGVAGAAVAATASADGFDMGSLDHMDVDSAEADEGAPFVGKTDEAKPVKTKKQGVGGLMKTLLILVLLIGGGYGAYIGAQLLGVEIPYLDKLKALNIPYVSDFFGAKTQDAGNLKITIIEKDVDGQFVSNSQLGMLYAVSGQVKNDYDHPRSFIQITGKLYAKGRKLEHEKTVYAGNVLSDTELAGLDQNGINKKLQNRMGDNRSNLNLKNGSSLPFMIVFTNLPKDPDEYTVEVAGSLKAKK